MKNSEIIKEIRAAAKSNGLTFKVDPRLTINGATAYKFTNRTGGETVMSNCTLMSAYDNVCSGYLDSWNGQVFEGVSIY